MLLGHLNGSFAVGTKYSIKISINIVSPDFIEHCYKFVSISQLTWLAITSTNIGSRLFGMIVCEDV